jgi:hypothetical protein
VFLTDFYIAYIDSRTRLDRVSSGDLTQTDFGWCWKSGLFEPRQQQLSLGGRRVWISEMLVKQCRLRVMIAHSPQEPAFNSVDVTRAGGAASRDVFTINLWGGSLEYENAVGMAIARRGGDGGSVSREFQNSECPIT